MNDERLILVTIGPVQSFIQQARRTIDFYAGSRIITKMIEWSYDFLKDALEDLDFKILYPYKGKDIKDGFSHFPNYFLAKARYDKTKFDRLEENLCNNLYKKLEILFFKILNEVGVGYDIPKLQGQLQDCFNIYLVYEIYRKDKYKESYQKLYAKLNARKNTRKFKQLKEIGRKCSVCGIRDGIFYNKDDENRKIRHFDKKEKVSVGTNKIKKRETLCFICFMKRFYDEYDKQKYPSTVGFATLGWENRKLMEQRKKFFEYKKYIETYAKDKIVIDEEIYYKDFIMDKMQEQEIKADKRKIDNYFKELYKDKDGNLDIPTKYYAAVKMDIDDLGKWLSGEYLDNIDSSCLFREQREISKVLYNFFRDISLEDRGKIVYAGGDDLLFFVTLDNLFEVIAEIESRFEKVKRNVSSSKRKLTFSTSIVIAHYKTPLSQVLRTLSQTLYEAKERYEKITSQLDTPKNAVAVTYITYSNTLRTTYFKQKNLWLMEKLTKNLKQKFSRRFIYKLENEFRETDYTMSYEDMLKTKSIFKAEIERLICRSLKNKKVDIEVKEFIEDLKVFLNEQLKSIAPNEYLIDVENYFNFLHIGESLSREIGIMGSGIE